MRPCGKRCTTPMEYKIRYLPLAVQDLHEIAGYLSGFYPGSAGRVLRASWDLPQYLK